MIGLVAGAGKEDGFEGVLELVFLVGVLVPITDGAVTALPDDVLTIFASIVDNPLSALKSNVATMTEITITSSVKFIVCVVVGKTTSFSSFFVSLRYCKIFIGSNIINEVKNP